MSILKYTSLFIFLLVINVALHAQSKDTLSARQVIENGSKGDVILGEKIKKAQLNDSAVLLHSKNNVRSKEAIRSSKKTSPETIQKKLVC